MGLFELDRRRDSVWLELWITGPDAARLEAVAAELGSHGGQLISGPWNAMADREDPPRRPWTVVVGAPSSLDPTLVAAIAHTHGCRYHPCGGATRWEDPAER